MKPLLDARALEMMKLNPDPSEAQRALFLRHKARGTTPGNPKWYKPVIVARRAVFVPGLPPKYPYIETGAQWFNEHASNLAPNPLRIARNKPGDQYIRAYCAAIGLAQS